MDLGSTSGPSSRQARWSAESGRDGAGRERQRRGPHSGWFLMWSATFAKLIMRLSRSWGSTPSAIKA